MSEEQTARGRALGSRIGGVIGTLASVAQAVAMAAIAVIFLTTIADVIARTARVSLIQGAYEIVSLLAAVAVSMALPRLQFDRAHIAVASLVNLLPRGLAGPVARLTLVLEALFFGGLCWRLAVHAATVRASGQRTDILELPQEWLYYLVAIGTGATFLVILWQLVFAVAPPQAQEDEAQAKKAFE